MPFTIRPLGLVGRESSVGCVTIPAEAKFLAVAGGGSCSFQEDRCE